eukprot:Hpha_TRINITY_DN32518_c0_g1::TRINITY_DN32518_c0_g1_i1::g.24404::m.24404
MAVRGTFVDAMDPRGISRKMFQFPGLEVDAGSVSSEWSTDSQREAEPSPPVGEQQQKKRRRRVKKWRMVVHLQKAEHLPPPVDPAQVEWFSAEKRQRSFCVIRGAFNEADIQAAHAAFHHRSVKEILDRKATLSYKHKASRVEMQMRAIAPDTYSRIIGLTRWCDGSMWRNLGSRCRDVYPEMEYIEYDVAEMGPCGIEPHVDNKSAVTMVALMSDPADFVGGASCFRRAQGPKGTHREVKLGKGDAVFFRGEKLLHWITPVTSGRRVILQNEMSRV